MAAWRENSFLKGRFHPEYPDDVQVLIHDGSSRLSDLTPELIWVRVVRQEADHFAGIALNRPENLLNVQKGEEIMFIAVDNSPHPIMVTPKYLSERKEWEIMPCEKCGFAELFDAPSDLIGKIFPDLPDGSEPEAFTSFCQICGGVQIVAKKGFEDFEPGNGKKWWQFWK